MTFKQILHVSYQSIQKWHNNIEQVFRDEFYSVFKTEFT